MAMQDSKMKYTVSVEMIVDNMHLVVKQIVKVLTLKNK